MSVLFYLMSQIKPQLLPAVACLARKAACLLLLPGS